MGWAKGLATPPQLIHVDMRTAERAGWFGKKFWATHLFRELQVALPGLRAVRWGGMSQRGPCVGKVH